VAVRAPSLCVVQRFCDLLTRHGYDPGRCEVADMFGISG